MFTIVRRVRPSLAQRQSVHFTLVPTLAVIACVALSSCGGAPPRTEAPPPAPTVVAPVPVAPLAAVAPLSGTVTLSALVETAKRHHPTAQAVAAARLAAEARAAQAGVWANPEIEVNYGQTRARVADLASDQPYGAQVSQRLEWWGKRRARVAEAQAQVAAAEADSVAALLDLEIEVRLAAIALASAQVAAEQAASQASLAQELAEVVAKRQAAGDIDHGEAARIRLEATTSRLRHDKAVRLVAAQVAMLRAWCGEALAENVTLSDALTDPQTGADGGFSTAPSEHPRIRAAREAERAAEARVEAERQARIPDVTIGVFGDREYEKDTVGVALGFEVPLWDRNAAGITEAEAERSQRTAQRSIVVLELERERTSAVAAWMAAALEVIALRDQAVPVAEEALRLRTTAFQSGDVSVADVLDARRAALAVQADLLDARRRHAESQVRMLAVSGTGGQP